MAQNVIVNKTTNIQNNYYFQAPPPQPKAGIMQTLVTGATGVLLGVAGKWAWDKYGISDKVKKITYKYFRNEDDEELRNMFLAAKRNGFVNTNHSSNVNYSKNANRNYSVNTNHSTNNINIRFDIKAGNGNKIKEKAKDNQQQTEPNNILSEESNPNATEFVPPQQDTEMNKPKEQVFSQKEEQSSPSTQEKIKYAPLALPDFLAKYKPKSLNEAFETLYSKCSDSFFQCTKQEFRYWFGGTMGMNFDAKTECKRINWKKGEYSLKHFINRLYLVNRETHTKGMWKKVSNVFLLDNEPIIYEDFCINVKKIGKEDMQDVDNMLLEFEEAMKGSRMVS